MIETDLPPGCRKNFFAWRYVSNILSLNNMYPIGSETIISTFSGNVISSTLPGITMIRPGDENVSSSHVSVKEF